MMILSDPNTNEMVGRPKTAVLTTWDASLVTRLPFSESLFTDGNQFWIEHNGRRYGYAFAKRNLEVHFWELKP